MKKKLLALATLLGAVVLISCEVNESAKDQTPISDATLA